MVTYEAMHLLFHFGMFIVTSLTAVIAIITLVTNKKEK
ncbi:MULTISPECIES: putative holin-like toxin [Sutcliffiella]|nr:putative holin-like toxin [Sutcliffiella cohnii]